MGEEAGGTHVHMDETSKRQTRFSEDAGEGVLSQVALHSPLNRAHTPIMGQALIDHSLAVCRNHPHSFLHLHTVLLCGCTIVYLSHPQLMATLGCLSLCCYC